MTTFSQLVDKMVLETRRPDLVSEIRSYVNQTIRELHFDPERNNAILYWANRQELLLTASVDQGEVWMIPRVGCFQVMGAVRYDAVCDSMGRPTYVNERTPGRGMNDDVRYYYRGSNYFTFVGYGGTGAPIKLMWYEFPRALKYHKLTERMVTWDDELGWTFDPSLTDPEDQEAALVIATNWLLERWATVVEEGIRAKVYKRVGDDTRSRTSYSLYAQLRKGIYTSELATQDGVY